LASVPSGGSGGAAAASGGAAAGGAPAEEAKEEAKEEGMLSAVMEYYRVHTDIIYREGRVRRGYGFRSFRLSGQLLSSWIRCSRLANTCNQGFWEELCGLCQWFACHGGERSDYTGLLVKKCQSCRLDGAIQTCFSHFQASCCDAVIRSTLESLSFLKSYPAIPRKGREGFKIDHVTSPECTCH
jgi:hypothetical protein